MTKNRPSSYHIEKKRITTYSVDGIICETEQEAQKYVLELRRKRWFEQLESQKRFEVKPHHLELIRKMRFTFDYYQPIEGESDPEFFIPSFRTIMLPPHQAFISPGNNTATIAQALDLSPMDTNERGEIRWTEQQEELIGRTYLELKIVLEILTSCLKIEIGTYQLYSPENKDWQKV